MDFVDTHCHPQFKDLADRQQQVLDGAKAAGVTRLIAVGTSLEDSRRAADFAAAHKNVWSSAGVHPHEATEFLKSEAPDSLKQLLNKSSKLVAVGEIGLDYYKNISPVEDQLKLFRLQIETARDRNLPFIFHVRDAWEDFWKVVDEYPGLIGVIHSFSSGRKQLKNALDRGFYIGLNGIMTFTRDESQLEAARLVPPESLLLETDAPFLAPAPYRGQVCEPKYVRVVAEFLASLRGESLEQLALATTANAEKLFGLKDED